VNCYIPGSLYFTLIVGLQLVSREIRRMSVPQPSYADYLPVNSAWHKDPDLTSLITTQLGSLTGVSKTTAEYRLIQAAERLEMYGASYHTARTSAGVMLNVAATSTGVLFFSDDCKLLNRYQYRSDDQSIGPLFQRATFEGHHSKGLPFRMWSLPQISPLCNAHCIVDNG